jgi:hypothetical protein
LPLWLINVLPLWLINVTLHGAAFKSKYSMFFGGTNRNRKDGKRANIMHIHAVGAETCYAKCRIPGDKIVTVQTTFAFTRFKLGMLQSYLMYRLILWLLRNILFWLLDSVSHRLHPSQTLPFWFIYVALHDAAFNSQYSLFLGGTNRNRKDDKRANIMHIHAVGAVTCYAKSRIPGDKIPTLQTTFSLIRFKLGM